MCNIDSSFYIKKNKPIIWGVLINNVLEDIDEDNINLIANYGLVYRYKGSDTLGFMHAKGLGSVLPKDTYEVYSQNKNGKIKKIKKIPVLFRDSFYLIKINPNINVVLIDQLQEDLIITKDLLKYFRNYKQYSKEIINLITRDAKDG